MGGCLLENPRCLAHWLVQRLLDKHVRTKWASGNPRTKVQFTSERKEEKDATFIDDQGKLKVIKDGGRRFTRMRDFHWNVDLKKFRLKRTILKPGEIDAGCPGSINTDLCNFRNEN